MGDRGRASPRVLAAGLAVFVVVTIDVLVGGPLTALDGVLSRWVHTTGLPGHGWRRPGQRELDQLVNFGDREVVGTILVVVLAVICWKARTLLPFLRLAVHRGADDRHRLGPQGRLRPAGTGRGGLRGCAALVPVRAHRHVGGAVGPAGGGGRRLPTEERVGPGSRGVELARAAAGDDRHAAAGLPLVLRSGRGGCCRRGAGAGGAAGVATLARCATGEQTGRPAHRRARTPRGRRWCRAVGAESVSSRSVPSRSVLSRSCRVGRCRVGGCRVGGCPACCTDAGEAGPHPARDLPGTGRADARLGGG